MLESVERLLETGGCNFGNFHDLCTNHRYKFVRFWSVFCPIVEDNADWPEVYCLDAVGAIWDEKVPGHYYLRKRLPGKIVSGESFLLPIF